MRSSQVTVVTTCNAAGYKQYGKKMLDSFSKLWDRDIVLYFYNEDIQDLPSIPNVIYRDLPEWFTEWKVRHKDHKDAHGKDHKKNRKTREYDFRRDCVKFAHKVAALTDIGLQQTEGGLVWIDADTLTHKHVDTEWLLSIKKSEKAYVAWLERGKLYPECGFLFFDCEKECHLKFMRLLLDTYRTDAVFKYDQTHDSFIIHKLVLQAVKDEWMGKPHNISGNFTNKHHPFVFSMLGDRLDHAKGIRKKYGRTLSSEMKGRRAGDYWKP